MKKCRLAFDDKFDQNTIRRCTSKAKGRLMPYIYMRSPKLSSIYFQIKLMYVVAFNYIPIRKYNI